MTDQPAVDVAVEIDPQECRRYVEQRLRSERAAAEFFGALAREARRPHAGDLRAGAAGVKRFDRARLRAGVAARACNVVIDHYRRDRSASR